MLGDFDRTMPFEEMDKIPRLSRECTITEKIDGTNAQIYIDDNGLIHAGSRTRWVTPDDDNFGFAKWVRDHAMELVLGLGFGRHYGEWWGSGIQRGYGLKEKRFSLFNAGRWVDANSPYPTPLKEKQQYAPLCCHVVPILYQGPFTTEDVEISLNILSGRGSAAAPGFMKPEGVIIYHEAARAMFKKTLEKDARPKSKVVPQAPNEAKAIFSVPFLDDWAKVAIRLGLTSY